MSQPIRAAEAPAGQQSPWRMFAGEVIAGGCGGAVGIAAAAPAMYFKTYHQLKAENAHNHPPFEKNPLKWFAGWKGLAGWMFPQTAFAFVMNEALRKKLPTMGKGNCRAPRSSDAVWRPGMLGPMVAVQELIWTQQKVAEGQGAPKSAAQVAQEIWSKHGVKGFFRGIGETSLRENGLGLNIDLSCGRASHYGASHRSGGQPACGQPQDAQAGRLQLQCFP